MLRTTAANLRRIIRAAGVLFFLGALCGISTAQQAQVTLDPVATKINISVHDVHGGFTATFKMKSGVIDFQRSTGNASGEIMVDATSGETGISSRDNKMHKEVLESQRYPEITFIPKRVIGSVAAQGKSDVQVQGVFHIHGADHDLTLSLPVEVSGDKVTATTTFVVPYQSWGMKNPSMLFLRVDGKAEVSISTVGHIKVANNSAH